MDDTKTISLSPAITFGNTSIDSLMLREPTVGEVDKATRTATGIASMVLMISLVTGQPRGAIEALPMRTFTECTNFLGNFMPKDPPTGDN